MSAESLASQPIDLIEATEVPYMLVGAFAAGFHGNPRSTMDVDLGAIGRDFGGVAGFLMRWSFAIFVP
jgi:hypothetical protein